jgi:hypothetical protein
MKRWNVILLLLSLFVILGMTGSLFGQSSNGTISGTVVDPTGAIVPAAQVSVAGEGVSASGKAATGPDGSYTLPNLPPGTYRLEVAASGFQTFVQTGITIHLNESVRVPVTLQLGASKQTIEVSAAASPLNYETPVVKGAVTKQEITQLPLQVSGGQRGAAAFVTILPGVTSMGTGDSFMARFNGGQLMSDEATMDGVSMMEGLLNQSGMVGIQNDYPVAPEAVGEISVLTSNYDVQYGSSPAAVIVASTKAGTDSFHGGGYGFLRNSGLNARPFGVAKRPFDIEEDVGGYIGGPINFLPLFSSGRRKSYFFVNNEEYRSVGATTKPILTVPTAKMRQGDFSEWPNPIYDPATTQAVVVGGVTTYTRQQFMGCNGTTPNVICSSDPRLASSLAQGWLTHVPPTNLPGLSANYESPFGLASSLNAHTDQWDIRGDMYIGDADHISTTYHYRGSLPFTQHSFPAVIDTNNTRIPNYNELPRLNWDHTFRSNLLNHFAFGYLDLPTQVYNSSDCCVTQVPQIAGVYSHKHEPSMNFGGYNSYGGNADFYTRRPTWVWNDMLTWVKGKHTLHMGGEFRIATYPTIQQPNGSGTFYFEELNTGLLGVPSGNSMASFLLGEVSSATASYYTLTNFVPTENVWNIFLGDTWKATSKLSVSLGVRWDVFQPSIEKNDKTSFLDPYAPNSGAGGLNGKMVFAGNQAGEASFGGRHPESTFYKGIGPRIGLAYSLSNRTVARGGFGIFFEQNFYPGWGGGIATDGFNETAGFSSSLGGLQPAFLLQNGFPQTFTPPPFISSSFLNGENSPNYRPFDANNLPRAYQWNLTVEHQFTNNFYINVAYVGNHGLRLTSELDPINALNPSYLSLGSSLYDQFQPGQTTLDGVAAPYAGWAQQMQACSPTVAQALVPFPQYCNNIYASNENIGSSTYNSLQVKAEKRMAHGVWILGAYTWSHLLTNADSAQTTNSSNGYAISPFQRQRNKSNSGADIPQVLTASLIYDLPFGAGKRFLGGSSGVLDRVIGGWQASTVLRVQSGTPVYFRSGVCNVPSQVAAACIPGVLSGANPFLQSGGSWDPGKGPLFNAAAFQPVSTFDFNLGAGSRVTSLRAFPYHNMDFGLSKTTKVTERVGIEIRIEGFNLWNWHCFTINSNSGYGQPFNDDISSPTFGTWTGAVSNPRNFQVGLKVLF